VFPQRDDAHGAETAAGNLSCQDPTPARPAAVNNTLLESSTTPWRIGIMGRVKAALLLRTRIVYSEHSFAELVVWRMPQVVAGPAHPYKYRLVYVSKGDCGIRYDNEAGKGDHVYLRGREARYAFVSPERLIRDFQTEIKRWNREDSDA
jgi:hypothetical protein